MTRSLDALVDSLAPRMVLTVAAVLAIVWRGAPLGVEVALAGLFTIELGVRAAAAVGALRRGEPVAARLPVLLICAVVVLSFLPWTTPALEGARPARLGLLFVYWSPLGAEFARVALRRERLQQLALVGGLAVLLAVTGAAVLLALYDRVDVNFDGAHESPLEVLWWALRQVESADNLVERLGDPVVVVVSLCLTGGGLLLVAVVIGLGTGLVEDLVRATRTGRVEALHHLVILNFDARSVGVLSNVLHYARHQLGRRRYAVQGLSPARPEVLDAPVFRAVDYRAGPPHREETLKRLNVPEARRVAVLATGESAESDARAIAAAMTVRRLRPNAWIVVELARPTNARAALEACGAARTTPVPARRLAALALAQELADPGRARLILDIVSLSGQELYTGVLGDGRFAGLPEVLEAQGSVLALRDHLLARHRLLLLGSFAASEGALSPILNPEGTKPLPRSRGLIALADRFEALEAGLRDAFGPIPEPAPADAVALDPVPPWLPNQLLVLGFNPDTVETVGELLRLFPGAEVSVVGRNERDRDLIKEAFVDERTETGAVFRVAGPKRIELLGPGGDVVGVVHARVADRLSDSLFRPAAAGPVGTVFDYDAVVMGSERGGEDPDAASVLGTLKLLASERPHATRLKRVVVELNDRATRDQLSARTRGVEGLSVSVVCTSELRDDILTHAFFVPGLPEVLHDLLTAGGHEVRAYVPRDRTVKLTALELVRALGARQPPLVPLAVGFNDGTVQVNPHPSTTLEFSEVRVVYCLHGQRELAGERAVREGSAAAGERPRRGPEAATTAPPEPADNPKTH